MKKQIIIQEKTFEKARKLIKENKGKKIIFTGNDDDLSRKILEKEPIDTLLINQIGRKDYQKQRNSGLNQVMTRIAKKNNIKIGINLSEIIQTKGKEKSRIIARIRQNIKLCNKAKLKMQFIIQNSKNKRNPKDLKAL